MLRISNIFLPSEIQYIEYLDLLPWLKEPFWLKDNAHEDAFKSFVKTAFVDSVDCAASDVIMGIRPALLLDNVMLIGSKIDFAGMSWTVCQSLGRTSLVVCDNIIARRRFDPESNNWNASELKMWLEEWLEYVCEGLDDVILNKERE